LLTGEGRRGGGGSKSYDSEEALSSLNPSILSASTLINFLLKIVKTFLTMFHL
jgi:hypothetical protein